MKDAPLRRFASSPLLRGGTHPVAGQSPFHGCLWLEHFFHALRVSGIRNGEL
jgi:hypothetical protein